MFKEIGRGTGFFLCMFEPVWIQVIVVVNVSFVWTRFESFGVVRGDTFVTVMCLVWFYNWEVVYFKIKFRLKFGDFEEFLFLYDVGKTKSLVCWYSFGIVWGHVSYRRVHLFLTSQEVLVCVLHLHRSNVWVFLIHRIIFCCLVLKEFAFCIFVVYKGLFGTNGFKSSGMSISWGVVATADRSDRRMLKRDLIVSRDRGIPIGRVLISIGGLSLIVRLNNVVGSKNC